MSSSANQRRIGFLSVCFHYLAASVHEELAIEYVSDLIQFHPLSLWFSVWIKKDLELNRVIVKDCLNLDHANKIPWLKYVKE